MNTPQQLTKTVLREGQGENPPNGTKVFVHYTGKLADGTVFDSSRSRGTAFSFVLGVGQVIKAWDLGVASMKKGEICLLVCPPEYAYGAFGAGPIPPNSTLTFEIECIGW